MKKQSNNPLRVDRRTTIKWLAATMVAANTGCSSSRKFVGEEIPPRPASPLLGVAGQTDGNSIGTDPDLLKPVLPWSRTMTDAQLEISARLGDLILPADEQSPSASAVGVPDFIDEWISAPYGTQQSDRELVLDGLEWLEQQSRSEFDQPFASAGEEQATTILDRIAWPDRLAPELADRGRFFERFRYLAVGAYYTTQDGMDDIGYIGNIPISGDYPGPSAAAMAHLTGVLEQLGLSLRG